MKFFNRLAIALLATMPLSLSAVAQDSEQSPVRLQVLTDGYSQPFAVKVVSMTDNLVVEDVIVNKGKCVIADKKKWVSHRLPKKLNYGESFSDRLDGSKGASSYCNVLDVQVVTNQGSWTWDF